MLSFEGVVLLLAGVPIANNFGVLEGVLDGVVGLDFVDDPSSDISIIAPNLLVVCGGGTCTDALG